MFFLKFLFITFVVILIILLLLTIYNKIKNPEKPFLNCIPFMDDFSNTGSVNTDVSKNANNKPLQVSDSATKTDSVSAKKDVSSVSAVDKKANKKTAPIAAKKASPKPTIAKKASPKKATSAKKTTTKAKAVKPKKKAPAKKGDNIKKVNGIGPVFEKRLNSIGINTFEQIAAWNDADVTRIDEELEFSGRPQREEWVAKAKILAAEKG